VPEPWPSHDDGPVVASGSYTVEQAVRDWLQFGLNGKAPGTLAKNRELRHSFVSLLSDAREPIEQIARLVGHSGTSVTEQICRHQPRPVLEDGATAMDLIFPTAGA
jgi:integrase